MELERSFGRPTIVADGRLEVGRGVAISSIPVPTHIRVVSGGRLRIGAGVTIAYGVGINVSAEVVIEDGAVLGPFVTILDHDFHRAGANDALADARSIRIGRGARLGAGVVVLRGVTIAPGAEILPGAVVARSLRNAGSYGGVPARPRSRGHGILHAVR